MILALVAAGIGLYVRAQPLSEAHSLSRAARYRHPLADVWAVVLDVGKYAEWRTDLASVERQADVRGHEVWREVPKRGSTATRRPAFFIAAPSTRRRSSAR